MMVIISSNIIDSVNSIMIIWINYGLFLSL